MPPRGRLCCDPPRQLLRPRAHQPALVLAWHVLPKQSEGVGESRRRHGGRHGGARLALRRLCLPSRRASCRTCRGISKGNLTLRLRGSASGGGDHPIIPARHASSPRGWLGGNKAARPGGSKGEEFRVKRTRKRTGGAASSPGDGPTQGKAAEEVKGSKGPRTPATARTAGFVSKTAGSGG